MDIFGLGWKLIQNIDKIDRATELLRPVIDKAAAAKDLQPTVKSAFVEFRKAWNVVAPVVDEFMKVDDELVPLLVELAQVFTPTSGVQPVQRIADYDVRWIQRTLLQDLGEKALPKFGVDGDYREETRAAVKHFQKKHPETGKADGWVGPRTAAVMEAINPPFGPRT